MVGHGRPWSARTSGRHRCRHQRVDLRDRVQHLRCARCGAEVGYDLRDGSGGWPPVWPPSLPQSACQRVDLRDRVQHLRHTRCGAEVGYDLRDGSGCWPPVWPPSLPQSACRSSRSCTTSASYALWGRSWIQSSRWVGGAGRPSGRHRCRHQRVDLRDRVQHLRHTRCGAEVGYDLRDGSGGWPPVWQPSLPQSACRSSRSCTTSASYALWSRSWIRSSRWVGGLAARLAAIAAAISVSIFEIVYNICVIRAVEPKLDTIFEMGRGRLGNVENTSEL